MNRIGIVATIEGCQYFLSSFDTTIAMLTKLECIVDIPPSHKMAIDPIQGTFESGGISLKLNSVASALTSRLITPITTLDADVTKTATTIYATDTSSFPTSGYIWIDGECMAYNAKDDGSDTFTISTRGEFETQERAHYENVGFKSQFKNKIYGFNPYFVGRQIKIWWGNLDDTDDQELRYIGYIESLEFTGDSYQLNIISIVKLLEDAQVMTAPFVKGTFDSAFIEDGVGSKTKIDSFNQITSYQVSVEEWRYYFPDFNFGAKKYLQIDDEIISYSNSDNPAIDAIVIDKGTDTVGNWFEADKPYFSRGDYVGYDFNDAIYDYDYNGVITDRVAGSAADYRYYHTFAVNPAIGKHVVTPLLHRMRGAIERGLFGTKRAEHERGAQVKEIRVIEGNHVDCILRLLLSNKTGGNNDSPFTILPVDWGIEFPQYLVDFESFFKCYNYSDEHRRFIFDSSVKFLDLLSNLARCIGARFFFSMASGLKANIERDIYPDSIAQQTITHNDICSIPRWNLRSDRLYNSWTWRGNALGGGDFKDEAFFQVPESISKFGTREMPTLEDRSLSFIASADNMELIATAVLRRYSEENPFVELEIQNTDTLALEPGQIVSLNIPHLPNLSGSTTCTGYFEILAINPNDAQGTITLLLLQMPLAENCGLIAPSGEVASRDGDDIYLKSASVTHFADYAQGSDISILPPTYDGTEDIHYFLALDNITIWDYSSFGSGVPNSHDTVIAAIDYDLKKITLAASPGGWTIAAGDIVRLSQYDTVKAGPNPTRCDWFIALASHTTKLLDGDIPNVWGL